jgi:hypothetical protein
VNNAATLTILAGVAIVAGLSVASYQRTSDPFRMSDHKIYAAQVSHRLETLEKMQAEFLARQKLNRSDIQLNTEVLRQNAQRLEMLCKASIKRACIKEKAD